MTQGKSEIERLYKSNYAGMYRLAVMILHDENQAHDVVQEVFVSLLSNHSGSLPGTGYLLSSVRNRCLNIVRDTELHGRLDRLYMLDTEECDSDEWPDEVVLEALRTAVDTRLTPQTRRVVRLRFGSGMKYAQIASELGISEIAVYKHLRQAIEIIRKHLANG